MEFAVRELGLKAAMIAGHVRRPLGKVQSAAPPAPWPGYGWWFDSFGEDSAYDYDPRLGQVHRTRLAASDAPRRLRLHQPRQPINNFMQNHLGHFASAGNLLCKSLFFSGVTHRFLQAPRRLPRMRRGVGRRPLRRHRRPVGEAQPRGAAKRRPAAPRRGPNHGALRGLRRRQSSGPARRDQGVAELAEHVRPSATPQTTSTTSPAPGSPSPRTSATASSPTSSSAARPTTR